MKQTILYKRNSGRGQALNSLGEGRYNHGCGYFVKDGKQILVAAGGVNANGVPTSSVEVFRDNKWNYGGGPLPFTAYGLRGVSHNNLLLMFGIKQIKIKVNKKPS